MPIKLYSDLVPWYRLIDPPEDHDHETASYLRGFERGVSGPLRSLLELGSGAGHNAFHLKRALRCTLSDLSEQMLALSRELNPDCEHVQGDMRTLRLGRSFDAVLVHDAVMYMTTEADLGAVAETAFLHTRAGGAAIFAPDCVRETFREQAQLLSGSDATRALRGIEWSWDPDPNDDTCAVEYGFLLRDAGGVSAVHDRHVEGLFSRRTWQRVLGGAGFAVEPIERVDVERVDEVFLCRKA